MTRTVTILVSVQVEVEESKTESDTDLALAAFSAYRDEVFNTTKLDKYEFFTERVLIEDEDGEAQDVTMQVLDRYFGEEG